ncbi:MAG: hypothetical protein K2O28_05185 [Clostridia bacterium]|nr:hypothetical protein [Clostridia bacterium]
MSESFEKLKHKHLLEAVIKSVICGVSCGLFAVGVVLLALKLSGVDLHFGFYILIGAAVAAGSGTGLFFVFRPTDVKSAKRIDKEYGLNEKVQTMVEFADQEGDILVLQREATGEILNNLPKRQLTAKSLWQYFVTTRLWQCVACAVLAVAIIVPALAIPPLTRDDGSGTASGNTGATERGPEFWEYSLEQQAAIADLILDLRNCSLDDATIKPAFIQIVEDMDKTLKSVDTQTRMKQCIYATVQMLDGVTDTANTYQKICEHLKAYDEELATAIPNAVAVYKSSYAQLTNFRFIKALEYELGDMIAEVLEEVVLASCTPLHLESNSDNGAKLNAFVGGLTASLTASGVNEDDALYGCVNDLRVSLRNTYNLVGKGYGISTLNTQIDGAFDTFKNGLVTILKEQSYNRIMDVFTRRKLSDIFGVPLGELPVLSDANEGTSGGNTPGTDPGGNTPGGPGDPNGGYGSGEIIFGSNDKIFDPDTGEYVEYGKLLNEYYQRFFDRILNGDFEYVSEYFNILFGGIDNSNKD